MSRQKSDLLRARYGLGATNLLGKGMEAEAYAYDEALVLKVYTNNPPLEQLLTLQAFYANLDASGLGYQLPFIFRVWEEEGWVLCLERRLLGVALSTRLAEYGDPRYDLATGWVFFDLYDELKRNVRARLGSVVRAVVSEGEMGILYRYILLYSFFTANVYAYEGGERHYRWCVGNLNNPVY